MLLEFLWFVVDVTPNILKPLFLISVNLGFIHRERILNIINFTNIVGNNLQSFDA